MESKVFVGGLPGDATQQEVPVLIDPLFKCSLYNIYVFFLLQLEDSFGRYGKLKKVWIARRPSGFAFIEFDDTRDAEDAVKALDGT